MCLRSELSGIRENDTVRRRHSDLLSYGRVGARETSSEAGQKSDSTNERCNEDHDVRVESFIGWKT